MNKWNILLLIVLVTSYDAAVAKQKEPRLICDRHGHCHYEYAGGEGGRVVPNPPPLRPRPDYVPPRFTPPRPQPRPTPNSRGERIAPNLPPLRGGIGRDVPDPPPLSPRPNPDRVPPMIPPPGPRPTPNK